jgi:hypothetical protein
MKIIISKSHIIIIYVGYQEAVIYVEEVYKYDFKTFILSERWMEFLLYCISFHATKFVKLILNAIDVFYCFQQQICNIFELF